jgi:hypothetical protein
MTNSRAWVRTSLAVLAAFVAGLSAAACGNDEGARPPTSMAERAARLQRLNGLLQRQVELAEGKAFYLVLDPGASDLTLMLSGAELQRYPVIGLQVGEPRVSWFARRDSRPWQDVVWSHGELDPPREIDRLVVEAPPPRKDAAEPDPPPVPPTPEEMYPVPSRYQVRFDVGRSIEVRPLDADKQAGRLARFGAWWSAKWHDVVAAAFRRDRDGVRLRIVLNPKDAASLYRSLPPAVRLIVISPGRASAPTPCRRRPIEPGPFRWSRLVAHSPTEDRHEAGTMG